MLFKLAGLKTALQKRTALSCGDARCPATVMTSDQITRKGSRMLPLKASWAGGREKWYQRPGTHRELWKGQALHVKRPWTPLEHRGSLQWSLTCCRSLEAGDRKVVETILASHCNSLHMLL